MPEDSKILIFVEINQLNALNDILLCFYITMTLAATT
jgi:hypothetical protein